MVDSIALRSNVWFSNLLVMLCTLLLGACSSNVHSDWSCKLDNGMPCVDISEADTFATTGAAPGGNVAPPQFAPAAPPAAGSSVNPPIISSYEGGTEPAVPLRSQEKIGRLWFAPFVDAMGNHHAASIIYVVDQESKWMGY